MDIEFHYHITYVLARKAGFDQSEAWIIAYASQYVDDNTGAFTIQAEKPSANYKNYITQTLDITKPGNRLLRIHTCFHFLPGDYIEHHARVKRNDGLVHVLTTTPDSRNARWLMDEAFKSRSLYRIGIATHGYADTWAHQNFLGYRHAFNGMKGLIEKAIPNIGHADAFHKPDIPYLIWQDKRLAAANRAIENKERFLEAAREIFSRFCKYNNTKLNDKQIQRKWIRHREGISQAIGREHNRQVNGRKTRIQRYKELVEEMPAYSRKDWFQEAVEVKRSPGGFGNRNDERNRPHTEYRQKPGFLSSHWFKFQEAVKEHQRVALERLKPVLEQVDLPGRSSF